jgi:16S rRNA (guanine966-N2)-methyltransferase
MRITAGRFKGRELRTAASHRPTKDQVRLMVFNILAERVAGARVTDLFAGSGSVGLEAWSRDAASVEFIENDRASFDALLRNVKAFSTPEDGPRLRCHREDALAWLTRQRGRANIDILFADPPYAHAKDHVNWAAKTLALADEANVLAPGGILVLELKEKQPLEQPHNLRPFLDRTYGITRVVMCERDAAPQSPPTASS